MEQLSLDQYNKLQAAGYSPAKIKAYEVRKGFVPVDRTVKKKGFVESTKQAIADIPEDISTTFNRAKDAVTEGIDTAEEASQQVEDLEITPMQGVRKTVGGGLKAGAKVVGEGFMGLLKLPFSPAAEEKIKSKSGEVFAEIGTESKRRFNEQLEGLRTSDDPTDNQVGQDIDLMIKGYESDPGVRAEIDGMGGVVAAAAELFGVGRVSKGVTDGLSTVRSLDVEMPKLKTPYFKEKEVAIADGIAQMKLNNNKVSVPENAPTITAAQEALKTEPVITFKNKMATEVRAGINESAKLDDVIARLDELVEQGKYKEAVKFADANTKDSITTRVTQKVIDAAVISGQKAAETYRAAVDGSTKRITDNLDRQALKETAAMDVPDVEQWMADKYVNSVSPGVKGKKVTLAAINDNKKAAVDSIRDITINKNDLSFRDVETNTVIEGELPSNLWEFGGAIGDQKRRVYKQIFEKIEASEGFEIDTNRIVEAMDEIIDDPVYQTLPQVQKRAEEIKKQYDFAEYTLPEIERIIQLENDSLQAFYRGGGSQADAIVSAMVANNLRDILDESIEAATGEGVKDLKRQYGNLAAIERDVVHRALHSSQAREAGLVDMFGIRTIGDVAQGMSGDLNALKNSAAQIAGEGFIKALNDRDALVNRMFIVADQTYTNQ